MTWTKIGAEFLTDPKLLSVPRGARLLHVEALVWCNEHGTDGAIPTHMLARISDEPDPEAAAGALVYVGLWKTSETGWTIVEFLGTQPSAADVERTQQRWRDRQRRQRQHRNGDHSLCDPKYCRQAANDPLSRGESPVESRPPVPNRSEPNRAEGECEVSGVGGKVADRSMTRSPQAPPRPSPTAKKGKGQAPSGLAKVSLGDGSGRVASLATSQAADEHVTIAIDLTGSDPNANATLLGNLNGALSVDLRDARRLHQCPRRDGNRRKCQAIPTGEGLEEREHYEADDTMTQEEADEYNAEPQDPPSLWIDVPAEWSKAWVETITWELQHGVGGPA
jgi:hypothetical protein